MNLDAGQLRSLQQTARGQWNKLTRYRQGELQELMLVTLDDYGSPVITTTGADALKEHA